jgi:formate-dependent nitrite reductase membrane component NrfD
MLRIVKLKSPMNLGSWTLAIYSVFASLQAALEPATRVLLKLPTLARLQSIIPSRVSAVMGMPFAWTLLSYPGVLLSTTSIPIWGCTRGLGMLMAASSMSSATAALSLIASFRNDKASAKTLHRIEWIVSGTEAATLTAYITSTGKAAKPLVRGMGSKLFWIGAVCAGLIVPALLRTKKSKTSGIVGSILTLAGAAALKWAIVHSGRESAMDRELAIHNADSGRIAKPAKPSGAAQQEQNVPQNRAIA